MGARGPHPRNAQASLLAGETRPSRVNFEEPIPRQGWPEMPRGMDAIAKATWRHVAREMGNAGVILGADRDVLRAYCETVSGYTRNMRLLYASASVIRGARRGDVVVNPLHRIIREEKQSMVMLARELGLTPSARAGLRVDLNAATGDLDDVLGPTPRLRIVGGEAG